MELRVQPKATGDQAVSSFVLAVGPPTRVHRYLDWNDNVTHHFTITRFHDRIEVASRSLVDTHPVGAAARGTHRSGAGPRRAVPAAGLPRLRGAGAAHAGAASRSQGRGAGPDGVGRRARAGARSSPGVELRVPEGRDEVRLDHRGLPEDRRRRLPGLRPPDAGAAAAQPGALPLRERLPARRAASAGSRRRATPGSSSGRRRTAGSRSIPPRTARIDERYVVVGHGRTYDDVPPNRGIYRGVAHETLRAEVHTQPSTAKVPPQLTNETRPIPLQTFREAPARRPASPALPLEDEQQQQQQQQ